MAQARRGCGGDDCRPILARRQGRDGTRDFRLRKDKRMDWNDFRLILAISRTGSLKGAAKSLGHDHSTIFRWLNALEAKFHVQLFERNAGVYRATDAGERMLLAAERMEEEALALDREITGQDARLSGNLRITCSGALAYAV